MSKPKIGVVVVKKYGSDERRNGSAAASGVSSSCAPGGRGSERDAEPQIYFEDAETHKKFVNYLFSCLST